MWRCWDSGACLLYRTAPARAQPRWTPKTRDSRSPHVLAQFSHNRPLRRLPCPANSATSLCPRRLVWPRTLAFHADASRPRVQQPLPSVAGTPCGCCAFGVFPAADREAVFRRLPNVRVQTACSQGVRFTRPRRLTRRSSSNRRYWLTERLSWAASWRMRAASQAGSLSVRTRVVTSGCSGAGARGGRGTRSPYDRAGQAATIVGIDGTLTATCYQV